ncbi:MAG: NYN domain-containing protein [Planctomycetota bacterium]
MLLVDAYNVLHTVGVLPPDLAGPDVPGLIRLIAHSRYADRDLTVVCDGVGSKDKGVSFGHARVLFSGAKQEADDLIERLITRYSKGRTLTVVSSDRRLHSAAKRGRARGLASAEFLRHLAEDHRRVPVQKGSAQEWAPRAAVPLDPYSVASWMVEFGFEPEPPAEPTRVQLQRARAEARAQADRAKAEAQKRAASQTFGQRLDLPEISRSEPPAETGPDVNPESVVPVSEVVQPGARRAVEIDAELRAALEEWRDVVSADDLDMSKWIDGVNPL